MDFQTIKTKLDAIKDIQTLPAIAMRVNRLVDSPATTPEKLTKVIENDQAIVAKLLKLVNSSFYGMPSKISSVSDAIILLGNDTVRNIVLSVSVMQAFAHTKQSRGINPVELWKHSLTVASISKYVSEKLQEFSPDDCFTGGLLHDLGKIILFQEFNDLFHQLVDTANQHTLTFNGAERKMGVATHAAIGAYLARKWKMPAILCDTIQYHHTRSPALMKGPALIIHTSDIIAHCYLDDKILGRKPDGTAAFRRLHPKALEKTQGIIRTSPTWFKEMYATIQDALESFL